MNSQNDVGTHVFHDLDRQILKQAAVCVNCAVVTDGREDPRQRHGGPKRDTQTPTAEHFGVAGHQIRRHAGERCREIVEVRYLAVRRRDLVEDERDLLA